MNEEPYGKGWMVRVRVKDRAEISHLMTAQEYTVFVEGLGH